MSDAPPPDAVEEASAEDWYIYDRRLNLLHVAATLARAETWSVRHWEVVEIADRQEVDQNDYGHLLLAAPDPSGYASRHYQARIARRDRVTDMGWDPDATPRFP